MSKIEDFTQNAVNTRLVGEVRITDKKTGEVIYEGRNAVHPQNCAAVIARALAREDSGFIHRMALGNGGTTINPDTSINYQNPNITGTSATLYNETYSEIVDDTNVNVGAGNSVVSSPSPAPAITSIITVTVELAAGEPGGQNPGDGSGGSTESDYSFDELGLVTDDELLLTHFIFSPIEKTANRSILIDYAITVNVS